MKDARKESKKEETENWKIEENFLGSILIQKNKKEEHLSVSPVLRR